VPQLSLLYPSFSMTLLLFSAATFLLAKRTCCALTTIRMHAQASAFPAVVLTLAVENTATTAQNASFMFNLPMGAWTDCSRASANSTKMPSATTHITCMKSCESSSSCASWQFTASTSSCVLNQDVPLTTHLVGSWCGIKSKDGWELKDGGLTRSTRPLAAGPSMGDMTLRPVLDSSGTVTASFASANDPNVLFKTFAEHGLFPTGSLVQSGDAAHGAVSVSTELKAGAKTTLSLIFSWHFPDRDFSHVILGNMCALSLQYSRLGVRLGVRALRL